ncbi:MAG: type III PLP-dependent enzyme [Nanoarchaeota archaeon]|nr:type III PLP-dependent enzyme [Nanoarchaeota archaeon]
MNKKYLQELVIQNETPLLVIDHAQIRRNYQEFRERLPRVQVYYAVKANPVPEIVRTLFEEGSSFDVASRSEFEVVFDTVRNLPPLELEKFIWDKLIYANPVKKPDSLHLLHAYKPLLTYDSEEEMGKILKHCPEAGLLLRVKVSDEGSMVKLSNKFGIEPEKASELIKKTIDAGLNVEGISFHVGSQCTDPSKFVKALESVAGIFQEADSKGYDIGESITRGYRVKIVDLGGGFPVRYNGQEQSFKGLSKVLMKELDRLFPEDKTAILAEPGRFMVANTGTAVSKVILAKHSTNPPAYHLDDGVYHTFSAMIYDHVPLNLEAFKEGEKAECQVFGPTCDGLDCLSENEYIPNSSKIFLPRLEEGDFVYAENMGAYSSASSTNFNGMPSAKILHVNVKKK